MRRRNRPGRQPTDEELKDAVKAEAAQKAASGDFKGARAALRTIKDIELRRELGIAARSLLPPHPVLARQTAIRRNNYKREWGLADMLGLQAVPPHPTRKEERAFARRVAAAK